MFRINNSGGRRTLLFWTEADGPLCRLQPLKGGPSCEGRWNTLFIAWLTSQWTLMCAVLVITTISHFILFDILLVTFNIWWFLCCVHSMLHSIFDDLYVACILYPLIPITWKPLYPLRFIAYAIYEAWNLMNLISLFLLNANCIQKENQDYVASFHDWCICNFSL